MSLKRTQFVERTKAMLDVQGISLQEFSEKMSEFSPGLEGDFNSGESVKKDALKVVVALDKAVVSHESYDIIRRDLHLQRFLPG